MITTSDDDRRDIDADATIKIGALTRAQLDALELPAEPHERIASALTSELEAILRRLTPTAPRAELHPRRMGRPAVIASGQRGRPNLLALVAALRVVRAAAGGLVAATGRQTSSVGRMVARLAAELFSPARRHAARVFCRTQVERVRAIHVRRYARFVEHAAARTVEYAKSVAVRSARLARTTSLWRPAR